jgi:transcriptional regulator with XRE-family HTH domain
MTAESEKLRRKFLDELKNLDELDDQAETLGERIVGAREAGNLTTAQLARRLGVKTETLSDWEGDRRAPRANRLMMLAGMLNVSPTWLLTGTGESPHDVLSETEMVRIRAKVVRIRRQMLALADELLELDERLDSYESYQS